MSGNTTLDDSETSLSPNTDAKFRAIFELSPDAMFLANLRSGKIIDTNEAAAKLFETTRDKLIGRHFLTLHPESASKKAAETFQNPQFSYSEASPPVEILILTATGKEKVVEIGNRLLELDGEKCLIGIFRDISERQNSALQLQNLLTDVKLAQKIAKIGHWQFDPDKGVPVWSEEVYNIYERDPASGPLNIKDYDTIYSAEQYSIFYSAFSGAINDGIPFDICLNLKLHDKKKWIRAICQPEEKPNGDGYILRGTIQDITSSRNAEIAISESEERFRSIFKQDQIVKLLIDPLTGKIEDSNQAAAKFYGYSEFELSNMKIQDINILSDEAIKNEMDLAARQEKNYFNFQHKVADGTIRDVKVFSTPIVIAGKQKLFSFIHDITGQKDAERKYELILKTSLDGYCMVDTDGSFLDVNASYCKMLGYTREELLKMKLLDVEVIEAENENRNHIQKIFSEGSDSFETKQRTKDGKIIDLRVNVNYLDIDGGKLVSFISDVTEIKKVNRNLAESENKYKMLLKNLNAGVVVHKPDTSIELVNDRACQLLGLSEEQLKGKEAIDPYWKLLRDDGSIMPLEEYPVNIVLKTKTLLNNYVVGIEHSQTNNIRWAIVNGYPEIDKVGNITYAVISFIDITDIKHVEKLKNEKEEKFRQIYNNIIDVYYEASLDGILLEISPSIENISIYKREELIGMSLYNLYANSDDRLRLLEIIMKNGKVHNYELNLKDKNGKIYLCSMNIELVRDKNGNPEKLVGMLRDITETKEDQLKLLKSERQLAGAANIAKLGPWELDVKEGVFTFNDEFYNVFRTSAEKEGGYRMTLEEYAKRFLHPDDIDLVARENLKTIETNDPNFSQHIEHRIIYADGNVGHLSVQYFVVKDEKGHTVKTYGVNQDITERKQTELALKKSEEKFAEYFNSNPSSTFVWKSVGDDFILLEVNETALTLIQDKASSLIGDKASNIYSLNPELLQKFNQCYQEQSKIDFEFYYRNRRSGTHDWLKFRFIFVEPDLIITYSDNINEQKQAEYHLKQSEARFKHLVETASDAIYLMNGDGYIIEVNQTATRMLMRERENLLGQPIDAVDPNLSVEEFIAHWAQTPYETQQIFETTHKTRSGKLLPVEVSGQKFKVNDQTYYFGIARDITERKKVVEALRKSEERFRLLAENIPSVIYLCKNDSKWSMIFINEQVESLTGYPHEEFINNRISFSELYHPDDSESIYREVENALAHQRSFHLIYRIKHQNGNWIWIEEFGTGIYENNKVISIEGMLSDITNRKQAEKELLESETRFKALHNASFGGITIHDKGIIIECNKGLSDITGFSYEELIGMNGLLLISDDTREKVIANISSGYEKAYEAVGVKKNGDRYPLRLEARNIPYKGDVVRVVEFRDITESKQAEEKLEKLNERFILATDSAKIGVWDLDLLNNFLTWDDRMFQLYGLEKSQFDHAYTTWIKSVHPDDIERAMNDVQQAINGEKDFKTEFRIILPNKEIRYLKAYAQVSRDAAGKPIRLTGVNIDVTKEKESEEIMIRSSKLESLGTLAGGIAHDFNNLLSGIFGNIELAKLKEKDEKILTFLERSIESIERAQNLTSQLLTFSKGGEPVKKVEKLDTFLKKVTEFSLSGSTVRCKYYIENDLMACEVDKNQIGQVIDNLVINAVQAMPEGGFITLSAGNIIIKNNYSTNLPNGNYIKITLKDEGTGIPEELLSKIFDPFFTTKSGGHGIGLATTYSIIKKHNGEIEVSSEMGKGTVFSIYLPAVHKEVPAHAGSDINRHSGSGRFIILDDDQSIRTILEEILTEFGYNVICMNTGEAVLDYVKTELNEGAPLAGMMFDLTIPGGMGGKEIINEVKKMIGNTPVFVFSGYSDNPIMANPVEYGFTGSLVKPFKVSDLIQLLNRHFGSS